MAKKKILVIDDEEDILITLRARLESQGYAVAVARDGKEGLKAIESEHPDLVILDVMLPDESGYAMIQKLKEKTGQVGVRKINPPVIVLTAKGEGVRDLFEVEGVTDFMVKPFESKELLNKISHALAG